ncbi:Sodium-dependent dicarboxylate transporter SdcS [compost metagenome]
MDWNTALRIPWGIILLFGGGFALEKGFEISGLTLWIASQLDMLSGSHIFFIILTSSFLMLLLTEFAANVTIAQAMLPLCVAFSLTLGVNPLYLMIPMTLCASMSFILPFSTPPNAIVFATGQFSMRQMILPGLILTIISGLIITVMMYYWGSYVFGV